jgi:hypothetical protein
MLDSDLQELLCITLVSAAGAYVFWWLWRGGE